MTKSKVLRHEYPKISCSWVTQDMRQNTGNAVFQGKLLASQCAGFSVAMDYIGIIGLVVTLCRLPEGKWVFDTNHIALQTVQVQNTALIISGNSTNPAEIQAPDTSQGCPSQRTFHGITVLGCWAVLSSLEHVPPNIPLYGRKEQDWAEKNDVTEAVITKTSGNPRHCWVAVKDVLT